MPKDRVALHRCAIVCYRCWTVARSQLSRFVFVFSDEENSFLLTKSVSLDDDLASSITSTLYGSKGDITTLGKMEMNASISAFADLPFCTFRARAGVPLPTALGVGMTCHSAESELSDRTVFSVLSNSFNIAAFKMRLRIMQKSCMFRMGRLRVGR